MEQQKKKKQKRERICMSARATEGDGRWVLLRRVQVFTFDSLFLDESTFSSRPAMQTAQDSLGKYLLSRLSMRSERRVCVWV